jgi:hypothetical protein
VLKRRNHIMAKKRKTIAEKIAANDREMVATVTNILTKMADHEMVFLNARTMELDFSEAGMDLYNELINAIPDGFSERESRHIENQLLDATSKAMPVVKDYCIQRFMQSTTVNEMTVN